MRLFTFCHLLALLIFASAVGVMAAPPNVVLIISDDQQWGDYDFMGHPQVQTPRLDRLARESLTFRRGYVSLSLCCPSLTSLVTGCHPHEHRGHFPDADQRQHPLRQRRQAISGMARPRQEPEAAGANTINRPKLPQAVNLARHRLASNRNAP